MISDFIYFLCFTIFATSVVGLVVNRSYFKKLLCLSLLQNSVIIFYILIAYIFKGNSPFLYYKLTVNPLPHVLMLTAIVVGIAVLAVGLSLVAKLKESYGSVDEAVINRATQDKR
ncbi:MAG: cation:proton antiporter subunit C [Rickettsiales bacterium]